LKLGGTSVALEKVPGKTSFEELFSAIIERTNIKMFFLLLFLLAGLGILAKGADVFIDGCAGLARRFRIPDFIVGLTLVAIGTSLPEFIVSLIAGFSKSNELVIGNIVGSNIANIALILGIACVIKPIRLDTKSIINRDIPFVVLASLVLLVLGFDQFFQNNGVTFNRLTFGDGLILLTFLVIFLFYVFGNLRSGRVLESAMENKEKIYAKESLSKLALQIIGGLLAVIGGGKLVVDNAVSLAQVLHISETIIGLTVVAIGTSLPEAVTTIVAVLKKKEDMAVGTIIGSNSLNIFFILGVSAALNPIEFPKIALTDMAVMIAFTLLLFVFAFFRKKISKLSGASFVALYVAYIAFITWRELY
jgi:cation:H+ antiporter